MATGARGIFVGGRRAHSASAMRSSFRRRHARRQAQQVRHRMAGNGQSGRAGERGTGERNLVGLPVSASGSGRSWPTQPGPAEAIRVAVARCGHPPALDERCQSWGGGGVWRRSGQVATRRMCICVRGGGARRAAAWSETSQGCVLYMRECHWRRLVQQGRRRIPV